MANQMVVVIEFETRSYEDARTILQQVKPIFKDQPGVKVYGATHETAQVIIGFLNQEEDDEEDGD